MSKDNNFLEILLLIVTIVVIILMAKGFYDYNNNGDKAICEAYANMTYVSVSYPDETITINNKTISLNYIKQSCINYKDK